MTSTTTGPPIPPSATARRSPTASTAPGARDAEGHRLHRRGPRQAARRRRDELDRDDAVQPEPARAGPARQARHPRGRRHADGVQHDLGLGRRLDGHRGHARLAGLARGDRRLDRARRARPPVRRPRLPRRLRQDDPGRRDGAGAARHARAGALQRLDRARPLPGPRRDDPGRLRGGRRARRREDERRGGARARERGLPGRRRVRRPVHGQHDVDGARLPRHLPGRPERHPGAAPDKEAAAVRGGQARDGPRARTTCGRRRSSRARRSRTPPPSIAATGGSTNGVLHLLAIAHELGIPLTLDDFDTIAARTPIVATSSRAAATSRPTCTPPAASASSRASC